MAKKYDLAVAYRIYPGVSKVPPVFSDDKYMLSELCLKSFKESLGSLRVKMWVLLDNCPAKYTELFRKYFDDDCLELIELPGEGNAATFNLQLHILLGQKYSEYVYFAEDDYLYLPNQLENMVEFIRADRDVDFVTPYDHLDYYTLSLHDHQRTVKAFGSRHWMTAASTCLTFLTTKATLLDSCAIFNTYVQGNSDAALWLSLTKCKMFDLATCLKYFSKDWIAYHYRLAWHWCWWQLLFGRTYKLWVPIPTSAIHMENQFLSPTINWNEYLKREAAKLANELGQQTTSTKL
ncbi:hypothetical protein SOV_08410 [Sporomusa ovata DSM 2662]|uniref:Glycosyltransferase 2-like domain-containing protein n=1 Tax=Sporomusa ovata TaxID=2378 RepID=A0A0U1L6B8_9FIRM|nr:glycosyltransferase [Sporomusa ovata]EQB28493.1 glycosyl transferase family 2 [Sporomusa ovata DSM 2662]CQR74819.1 hypothetical protein SpAn4DRAFT_4176 [Sporomusa ovata]